MRTLILKIINTFFNILLLRESPAALPFSYTLLSLLVACEFFFNTYSLTKLKGAELAEILLANALSLGVLIGMLYVVLSQRKHQERWHKVVIAWFGTELLLTMLINGIYVLMPEVIQSSAQFQVIITLLFSVWNVAIKGHILRCSLEIKLVTAILITFGIILVSFLPIPSILYSTLQPMPT